MGQTVQTLPKADDPVIRKLVSKLPFDAQSSVSALLMMAKLTAENAEKVSACQAVELIALRAEVRKKTSHIEQLQKGHAIYQERIVVLEEKLKSVQDAINAQQRFTHQNKRAVAIMSSTNRMLIESLEALRGDGSSTQRSQSNSDVNEMTAPKSPKRISFETANDFDAKREPVRTSTQNNNHANATNVGEGDKLKESLLRVSREHYKYVKRSEALEKKVFELRSELETMNQKNRDLKQELEEYRDGSGGDVIFEMLAQKYLRKSYHKYLSILGE